jgi:hypothetical protein
MPAFAKGKSYVILVNMANKNPEAKKLLDDLKNIEQEEFDKRFGELLNSKGTSTKLEAPTSNPLENIKPIDSETSFAQPKPNEVKKNEPKKFETLNKSIELMAKYKDLKDANDSNYKNDKKEIVDGLLKAFTTNDNGINDFYANKQEEYSKWYLGVKGYDDRAYPLEEFMKDEYKRPKLVSKEEFKKLAQGKKMYHRGVSTIEAMTATYNSDEPYFLHQGYIGDGIYFADDFDYASTYGKPSKRVIYPDYSDANVMSFIIPDDVKLVDVGVIEDIQETLQEDLRNYYKELEPGKEKTTLDNLWSYLARYGETYLAKLLGYDGVYRDMEMQWGKHPGKEEGSPLNTRFINLVNMEKLITYDATKEGRIDK